MKYKRWFFTLAMGLGSTLLLLSLFLLSPPTSSSGHIAAKTNGDIFQSIPETLDPLDTVQTVKLQSKPSHPRPDMILSPSDYELTTTPFLLSGSNVQYLAPVIRYPDPEFASRAPLTPPLPGNSADFVVGMNSDRVWGLAGVGETVTVTVDRAQVGAARADGTGFFWTTLYDSDGNRLDLNGGETVVIYCNGTQVASTTLHTVTGQIDPRTDDVSGTIGGTGFPLEVTIYAGLSGEPAPSAYSQTVSTNSSGAFTIDFTGKWDFFADEQVIVAYTENDVDVYQSVFAQRLVIQPFPLLHVLGFTTPGAAITVTVYTSDTTTIREQITGTTNSKTGQYYFSPDMETTDSIIIEVAGGPVMSRTIEPFEINMDAQHDRVLGTATPGDTLCGRMANLTGNGYETVIVHGVADASGVFTLDFSAVADLMPGQWVGVYNPDAEGDDLNLWAPAQGSVEVNQTWNEVNGWAVTPPGNLGEGHPLTLTLHSARNGSATRYTKGSGWYGDYNFNQDDDHLPDIGPGDVVTVESQGFAWQGVVHVMTMTAQHDTIHEWITGGVVAPSDRVEIWARQWNGWSDETLFPVAETFNGVITAHSSFTAAPPGFDVRNAMEYEINHRTADELVERISAQVDYARVWQQYNGVSALFSPPGTPYTLTLRDRDGHFKGKITGISTEPDGNAGYNNFSGVNAQIYNGDWIEMQSAAGIDQMIEVVTLTGVIDISHDHISGYGPPNVLLNIAAGDKAHGFVPTGPDGAFDIAVDQLQVFYGDGDLSWGDWARICYINLEGNHVCHEFEASAPDVEVQKWTTSGYARPGGVYVYGISYANQNDATGIATDTLIVDTLPLSTTYAGDTSGLPLDIGAGGVLTWHAGNLAPGDSGVFMLTIAVPSNTPTGTEVISGNCVSVTTSAPGDTDPGNDGACVETVDVGEDEVDVGVNTWPNTNDPAPGQEFDYTIQWCNHRTAATGPVWLTDTLPVSTTLVRWEPDEWYRIYWSEVSRANGQLVLYAPGLPGPACLNLNLRLQLDTDAPLGMILRNHVVITTTHDINTDDNTHLNTDAQVSGVRYDLNSNKWFNYGVLVPGGWIHYGVHHWNQGNTAIEAWLTDTLSTGTAYRYGSAQRHDGSFFPPDEVTAEHIAWSLGEVAVSDGFGFNFVVDIDPTVMAGEILTNCVTVDSNVTDDDPANNITCVAQQVFGHGSNLRVTKEHWWNGDGQLGYRLYFYNVGDEAVSNVWITDTLPAHTTWDGWWNLDFDWSRLITQSLTSDVLAWRFSTLYPGDTGTLEFNANLDKPGVLLRWYTDTVQITTPARDTDVTDNFYEDIAFSGGEVEWVNIDVYRAHIWACAPQTPFTVTTKDGTWTFPWDCFDEEIGTGFLPGDTLTVTAGAGSHPVIITVPDPFTGQTSSITDTVWGQIDALDHEPVRIGLWDHPWEQTETDDNGYYSATFADIPRGAQGDVEYPTEIDYANVTFYHRLVNPDLRLQINYADDWIEGEYEAGHTLWVTVTDNADAIKATAEMTTGAIPWWGDRLGFSTNLNNPWIPDTPDLTPGDWVHGNLGGIYTSSVKIGQIDGEVDIDHDVVTITLNVDGFSEMLSVDCYAENGPRDSFSLAPNGGSTICDLGAMGWDLQPGQNVWLWYREPDYDEVANIVSAPAPYVRINTWADANPGTGGNFIFYVSYRNEGNDSAESTVITATLQGATYITDTSGFSHSGSGSGPIVWDLGTLAPGEWIEYYIFVQITANEGETVENTVQIATTDPHDMGDPGEKESTWSGQAQANDTHLNIGKGAWTGDPAPDTDVVFPVNACNNGGTASSDITLTDTLHPSMTLQTWWGDQAGWVEVNRGAQQLVLTRPAIFGWSCTQIYVRAHVDVAAWPGMSISNTAVLSAANDMEDDNNETTWWGNVNAPHHNLYIHKNWNRGQLIPGGKLRYNVNLGNNGNVPVATPFYVTDTLPVSTTFNGAFLNMQYGQTPFTPVLTGNGYVVWEINGLDNGYNVAFEVVLDVDRNVLPGTVLTNTVTLTAQPNEDNYNDNASTWVETLNPRDLNLRVHKEGSWDNWGSDTRRASYGVNIENVGDTIVAPVVFTDTYDSRMVLDGGIGGDYWRWWHWQDDPASHMFTVTLESLYPGENTSIDFGTYTDTAPLPFGLIFTNTAEVSLAPNDANPSDNTDTSILTTGPDLYVKKKLIAGDLFPGELITFSLVFGNDVEDWQWWWATTGNTLLTDTLPVQLEYVTSTLHWCGWTEWCAITPNVHRQNYTWQFGPMNSGDWNEIYLTVRITDTATGLDTFTNRLKVASDQPTDIEPYADNNVATADIVVSLPYFEVSKDYESTKVAGASITYTLMVTNAGNTVGTGIILSDTLPQGLKDVSGGTIALPWMWWYIDTIPAKGGSATAMFKATLPCTGTVTNADYRVFNSDQGVSSATGAPVSVDIIPPTLDISFEQNTHHAVVSTTLVFTGSATTNGPDISAWAWDFGDESTATLTQYAAHTYTTDGTFTVRLTVTDTCGYTATATGVVTIAPPTLVANFTQSAAGAEIGETVFFTSTGTTDVPPIVAWAWDFGDNSILKFGATVTHAYPVEGTFTVTLTISDSLSYHDNATSTITIYRGQFSIYLPLVMCAYSAQR